MKIGILGDGAMGCLFGAYLSQKNDVIIFGRSEEKSNTFKLNGITIEEKTETKKFKPMSGIYSERFGVFDLLILFVKSFALEEVLAANKDKIGPETYILCLQNGAGHEKIIQNFVDKSKILLGTTQQGATVVKTGEIRHTGIGDTVIGFPFYQEANKDDKGTLFLTVITLNFILCGIETKTTDNVLKAVWHKIFTNASASLTTALLQVPMDYLAKDENAWAMVEKLIEEDVKVAFEAGFNFDFPLIREEVRNIAKCSPGGITSICSDIKNGRKTEVDCIAGYVLSEAKRLGIEVPCTKFAVEQIHALENKHKGD